MIKAAGLTKTFGAFTALNDLNMYAPQGAVYGLVGVNGSGKTTLIKHLTGAYRQDKGEVTVDGQPVYDNEAVKRRIGYIPDDLYFWNGYNLGGYRRFYGSLYKTWDYKRYAELVSRFGLNEKRRLTRFSKGMQKQAAFTLVMSQTPDILILDEPIDGLDPIARKLVMDIILRDVKERGMTALISSHNLKEMEGFCTMIGIMKDGAVTTERRLSDLTSEIHKIQSAFPEGTPFGADKYAAELNGFNILSVSRAGSVETIVAKGDKDLVTERIKSLSPYFMDFLPLTLEEVFAYEAGGEHNALMG